MAGVVIVDAGPLVPVLSSRDEYHGWAREQFALLKHPCFTCEAVLSECYHMLEDSPAAMERMAHMLERGAVRLDFQLSLHLDRVLRLMRRYVDEPMSLADACLVRMSETIENSLIFSLDRHFLRYRKRERQVIPLLAPWYST